VIRTIYIDTSVFGGYFDEEVGSDTEIFFEKIILDNTQIVVSDVLETEIYKAPAFIIDFFESLKNIERIELSDIERNLAEKYISEKVVGRTSLVDCQHIALATVANVDVLTSWNFKHIVNLERIRGYNSINLREGYRTLEIRTPKEIFDYERNR